MSSKLLSRLSEFVDNQTEEPTKKDLADVMKQFFKEKAEKAKKEKKNSGDKPKRKPSLYNEFYKAESAKLKLKEASLDKDDRMTAKEKMSYIAALWKEKKEEAFEEAKEEVVSSDDEAEAEPEPEPPKAKETVAKKGKGGKGDK